MGDVNTKVTADNRSVMNTNAYLTMLNKLKPYAFASTAAGTVAFITGICGLFVVGASKPNQQVEQIKTLSNYLGMSGAVMFVVGFPVVMAPTTKTKKNGEVS